MRDYTMEGLRKQFSEALEASDKVEDVQEAILFAARAQALATMHLGMQIHSLRLEMEDRR